MTNKEEYSNFCKKNDQLPIFMQDWWLEITSNGKWDVSLYKEGSEIKGFWTYTLLKKYGSSVIIMPPLTKFMGLYLLDTEHKNTYKRISQERKISKSLTTLLPDYKYLNQNFHYSITDWLPLFWNKFSQSTYYSYVIKNTHSNEEIFSLFKPSLRNEIRKGEESLSVVDSSDVTELWKLLKLTYFKKNNKLPYEKKLLIKLAEKSFQKNSGKIVLAQDRLGRTASAAFFVWDKSSYYYLIGASDPSLKKLNGNSFLLWNGINEASKNRLEFDFEGSMVEPIEKYFRSFGAEQKPYFRISHSPSFFWKINNFIKDLK